MNCQCDCKPIKKEKYYDFKVVMNELTERFEVLGKDGWMWSEATTPKGAVQGALACGLPVSKIDFGGNFIPIWEL
jgi:hypothetical protein